ncbi:hypothetical protein WJX74_000052 [Apatococcus lobatus]|uniref:Uncharacterized protein n=1 Tax=Apatococcus lobatus TaxID=904363 RepID=A0AAW1QAJ1_9CHLO
MSAADGDTDSTAQGTPPRGLPESHVSLTSAAATGDVKDLEGQLGWLRECLDQCQTIDSSATSQAVPAPSQLLLPKQPPQLQHTAPTDKLQVQDKQDAFNTAHEDNDWSLAAQAAKPGELEKQCRKGAILNANGDSSLPSSGNQAEPASNSQVPLNVGLQPAATATSKPAPASHSAGVGQHAGEPAAAIDGQHGIVAAAEANAARISAAKQTLPQPDKQQAGSSSRPVSPSTRRDRCTALRFCAELHGLVGTIISGLKATNLDPEPTVQKPSGNAASSTFRPPLALSSLEFETVSGLLRLFTPPHVRPGRVISDPVTQSPWASRTQIDRKQDEEALLVQLALSAADCRPVIEFFEPEAQASPSPPEPAKHFASNAEGVGQVVAASQSPGAAQGAFMTALGSENRQSADASTHAQAALPTLESGTPRSTDFEGTGVPYAANSPAAAAAAAPAHGKPVKPAGSESRSPHASMPAQAFVVVGSVDPEAAAPSLDALDPYLREPYETWGQEELAAKFLLAYHQSAGGPWPLLPRLWVDRAIGRDFYPFIQARKAGQGKAPRWVESPKSKEHPAERELEFEVFQRLVDVLEASPSGWAEPAAAMGEGHDATVLAKLRHLATAYRCGLLSVSDWQLANEHLKLDRILACACEHYPPDPDTATSKIQQTYKLYRLADVRLAFHSHFLPHVELHVELKLPPKQPAAVGKDNIPLWEQSSFIILKPKGLRAEWVWTDPRLVQAFKLDLLAAQSPKETPAARVHIQLLQTARSEAVTCKEKTFTFGELVKVMPSLSNPVVQSLVLIMREIKAANQKWQQDLQAFPSGAGPPCTIMQHNRLFYQDKVGPANLMGVVRVRWLPTNSAGRPASSSETSSGKPSSSWSKIVGSRLRKLDKQENQFDAALWAEAQLRGCASPCLPCLPDDELAEEHFELLVGMVEASQQRLALLSPAYEESLKACSATRLLAYQAICHNGTLQPSEEQLVKHQLGLEREVCKIRTQSDSASQDSGSEEDHDGQSIKERVRIAIHRHLLPRSSRYWRPNKFPMARDVSGVSGPVHTSLIFVNPCTDGVSRASLTRQALEERAEAFMLTSPTATVTVETFEEHWRMLHCHQVECFKLGNLRTVLHRLQNFALAAILDIMDGVDQADRAWLQSLEAYLPGHARPCRVQDFKRLVYRTMVASSRLHGVVHIRRLPQRWPASSTVSVRQAKRASAGSAASAGDADPAKPSPAEGNLPQASKPPQQSARSHADASTLPAEQGTKATPAAPSDSHASTFLDSHEQAIMAGLDAGTHKAVMGRLANQFCPKREARKRSEELMARELKEERNRQAWARIGKEPPPPKVPKPAPSPQQKKATVPVKSDVAKNSLPASGCSGESQPDPDAVAAAQEATSQPRLRTSTSAQKSPKPAAAAAAAGDPKLSLGNAAASGAEPSPALESVIIQDQGSTVASPCSPPDSLQGQLASCNQPEQITAGEDKSSEGRHNETDDDDVDVNDDDLDEDGDNLDENDELDSVDQQYSCMAARLEAAVVKDAKVQANAKAALEKAIESGKEVAVLVEQAAEAKRESEEAQAALMELTRQREANAAALLREEEAAAKAAKARKEARQRKQAQRRARDKARLHHRAPNPPSADAPDSAGAAAGADAVPGLSHPAALDMSLPPLATAGSSCSAVQWQIANGHDDRAASLELPDSNEPTGGLAAAEKKPEKTPSPLAAAASASAGTQRYHSRRSAIPGAPSGMQQQGSSKTHAWHANSPAPDPDVQCLSSSPLADEATTFLPGENQVATQATTDTATATDPELASHGLHRSLKSDDQAVSAVEASADSLEQSQRGSSMQSSSNAAADNGMQPAAQSSKHPRQRRRKHAQRISVDKSTSPPPDASGVNQLAQLQESPSGPVQKNMEALKAGMSTDTPRVLNVSNSVAAAASAPEPDIVPLVQLAQAGRASDMTSTAFAGGQFSRPKPMGLHRRLASQGLAPSPARPVPKGHALLGTPAGPNIESLLAEIFQNNQAANTPAEASMKRDAAVASSASSENAIDLPEAAQLMASMAAAMATIGQASAALTASIHQAASWLGQRRAQAANPAQQDQVRERMRTSKAALLKLRPIEAMVAEAVKNVQPDAAEDEECQRKRTINRPPTTLPASHVFPRLITQREAARLSRRQGSAETRPLSSSAGLLHQLLFRAAPAHCQAMRRHRQAAADDPVTASYLHSSLEQNHPRPGDLSCTLSNDKAQPLVTGSNTPAAPASQDLPSSSSVSQQDTSGSTDAHAGEGNSSCHPPSSNQQGTQELSRRSVPGLMSIFTPPHVVPGRVVTSHALSSQGASITQTEHRPAFGKLTANAAWEKLRDDAIQPGPLLFTRQDEKSAAKAAKKAAKKQRKRHQQPPDGELRPENFELVVDALAALHSGSALPAAGHIGGTNTSAFAKLRALDDAQQQGLLLAAEGQLVKQHVELHRVMASIWGPDAQSEHEQQDCVPDFCDSTADGMHKERRQAAWHHHSIPHRLRQPPASSRFSIEGAAHASPSIILVNLENCIAHRSLTARSTLETLVKQQMASCKPVARVAVESFEGQAGMQSDRALQCFSLADVGEIMPSLSDSALAALFDIMTGMQQCLLDRSNLSSSNTRPCSRIIESRRLAYKLQVAPCNLMTVVHAWQLLGDGSQACTPAPIPASLSSPHGSNDQQGQPELSTPVYETVDPEECQPAEATANRPELEQALDIVMARNNGRGPSQEKLAEELREELVRQLNIADRFKPKAPPSAPAPDASPGLSSQPRLDSSTAAAGPEKPHQACGPSSSNVYDTPQNATGTGPAASRDVSAALSSGEQEAALTVAPMHSMGSGTSRQSTDGSAVRRQHAPPHILRPAMAVQDQKEQRALAAAAALLREEEEAKAAAQAKKEAKKEAKRRKQAQRHARDPVNLPLADPNASADTSGGIMPSVQQQSASGSLSGQAGTARPQQGGVNPRSLVSEQCVRADAVEAAASTEPCASMPESAFEQHLSAAVADDMLPPATRANESGQVGSAGTQHMTAPHHASYCQQPQGNSIASMNGITSGLGTHNLDLSAARPLGTGDVNPFSPGHGTTALRDHHALQQAGRAESTSPLSQRWLQAEEATFPVSRRDLAISSARPKPMGKQRQQAVGALAKTSSWPASQANALQPPLAWASIEHPPMQLFHEGPARSSQLTESHGSAAAACSHASDELLEADQMLSEMDAAVDTVIQASVALSSSIHRATRWLGHSTAQSVNPAKLQQVRERMRKSKVTLQKLSSAAAEGGCSMQQTAADPGAAAAHTGFHDLKLSYITFVPPALQPVAQREHQDSIPQGSHLADPALRFKQTHSAPRSNFRQPLVPQHPTAAFCAHTNSSSQAPSNRGAADMRLHALSAILVVSTSLSHLVWAADNTHIDNHSKKWTVLATTSYPGGHSSFVKRSIPPGGSDVDTYSYMDHIDITVQVDGAPYSNWFRIYSDQSVIAEDTPGNQYGVDFWLNDGSGKPVKTFDGVATPSLVTIFGPGPPPTPSPTPSPKPTPAPTPPPTLEPVGDQDSCDDPENGYSPPSPAVIALQAPDNRIPAWEGSTATFPAIGLMFKSKGLFGSCAYGSAFAIGPNHILTAAHMLYHNGKDVNPKHIDFGKVGKQDHGVAGGYHIKVKKYVPGQDPRSAANPAAHQHNHRVDEQ